MSTPEKKIQNIIETSATDLYRQLCNEFLTAEKGKPTEIETIPVEGSDSGIYPSLLKGITPTEEREKAFLNELQQVCRDEVKSFRVPVCDPSINPKDGSLQFVEGYYPAVGYNYCEIEQLAIENGVHLGSKNQYILFLATIIYRLYKEGWTKEEAIYAVCRNSSNIGNYDAYILKTTGSTEVAGKCDLGNTYKFVRGNGEGSDDFFIAGGCYCDRGNLNPISTLRKSCDIINMDSYLSRTVPWFVVPLR